MLEHLLRYIIDHNETVIQWLVVSVLGLTILVMGFSIFGTHTDTESSGDFRRVQRPGRDTEPTTVATAASVSGGVSGATGGGIPGASAAGAPALAPEIAIQIVQLQQELSTRNQELEKLKAQPAVTAAPSAEIDEFQKKIKDLEGKLAEYEILEDDIADLSLYKEENARLKQEIQRLGGAAPGPEVPNAVAPASATAAPAPDTAAATESPAPAAAPPVAPPAAKASEVVPPTQPQNPDEHKGDDIVAEFANAVEAGRKKPEFPLAGKEGDDLLTEFAEPAADGLDTDKMLAEVASLETAGEADGSGLEADADMEKMAAEATKLLGNE